MTVRTRHCIQSRVVWVQSTSIPSFMIRFNTSLPSTDHLLQLSYVSIVEFRNRKSRRVVASTSSFNWLIIWRHRCLGRFSSKITKNVGLCNILYYGFCTFDVLSKWIKKFCMLSRKLFFLHPVLTWLYDYSVVNDHVFEDGLQFTENLSDCKVPNHFLEKFPYFSRNAQHLLRII
jgi:hypothetical protein